MVRQLLAILCACSSLNEASAAEIDGEYVVVQDPLTHKCRVSEARPGLANSNRVDERISYPTRRDAEIGLSVMKPCMLESQRADTRSARTWPR